MANINLAPGTEYITAARKRRRRLFVLSVSVAILLALVWLALYFMQYSLEQKQQDTTAQIRAIELETAKLADVAERITLFEDRLVTLDELLDDHISWNPLLSELERLLPSPAVLTTVASDSGQGSVEITGSVPDLDQAAQLEASLKDAAAHQTVFSAVHISSIDRKETAATETSPGSVRYQFSANLIFDPSILRGSQ